jgi:hypothetical protein
VLALSRRPARTTPEPRVTASSEPADAPATPVVGTA